MKASYLMICILNSGLPTSEANNEAPRPEIDSYSPAEAPGPICFAPPATSPSSGASPPPRGLRQQPSATEFRLSSPCRRDVRIFLKYKRFAVGLSWIGQSHPKSSKVIQSHPKSTSLSILSEQVSKAHQGLKMLKKDKSFESAARLHET